MKKNYILYVLGAIAIFYVLKKKGIIGKSDLAENIAAQKVENLNFNIDYDNYEKEYRKEQERPAYSSKNSINAEICN
jgi:hypothetical protein